MIRLGERQKLKVVKKVDFGIYLAPEKDAGEETVLLPIKQVEEGVALGDLLDVFVYKDSKDRLIATIRQPLLTLGKVACLQVKQVNKMGAFMDWGLEKDLFLPFKEQTKKVNENEVWPVALYIDKSSRLCATMKVYHYLETNSPYKKDDEVSGIVYEISGNFGAFVIIDEKYSALIPKKELYGNVQAGDRIKARVASVKPDGKLELSIRQKAYQQIETDATFIMKVINEGGGRLPFTDKASPELIKEKMQMSKNEFKRGVGHLLKKGKIEIKEDGIYKK